MLIGCTRVRGRVDVEAASDCLEITVNVGWLQEQSL